MGRVIASKFSGQLRGAPGIIFGTQKFGVMGQKISFLFPAAPA